MFFRAKEWWGVDWEQHQFYDGLCSQLFWSHLLERYRVKSWAGVLARWRRGQTRDAGLIGRQGAGFDYLRLACFARNRYLQQRPTHAKRPHQIKYPGAIHCVVTRGNGRRLVSAAPPPVDVLEAFFVALTGDGASLITG